MINARARAHQVAVAIHIVYAVYARPEFVVAHIGQREHGFFAAVGVCPFAGHVKRGVRGVDQRVVVRRPFAALHFQRFLLDLLHGGDKAVELGAAFALGGLDHQRACHGEAHGGRVEAVVHQAFGDVHFGDAALGF